MASPAPLLDSATPALRSVHTSNLPELFDRLQISLVVSTYQAGKAILIRSDQGKLNTHFRTFGKPMGIAADESRIVIGGANTVWEYRNMPAVARKLDPPEKHDACYIPRRIHVTGDIDIHELAWDKDNELWLVNTRFCCLCTLDADHSFYPRWRPPFVSALAPEDRCHLNGLAVVDGRAKFVTALGETDTEGGWRANKANGGVLIDVDSGETLLRGLSMPHSPRWYQDRLWILESGQGSLAQVDLKTRSWKTIAQLPGFTRGIDFVGPLAFIGLSQVRESAVFSGIPLVKRAKERACGVWVVNIETGATLGFLRFETGVQEIFAVQALQGVRFPEMLEWDDPRLAHSYVLPDEALAEVHLPSPAQLAQSPAFHFQRGNEFYQRGELAQAIEAYRQCVALQAEFPNASYNLAIALGDAGNYPEAEDLLKQVVEAEPERAEAHNSLGFVAMRRRRPDDAIVSFERALAIDSDYAHAHRNLGMALLQKGELARGFAEYEWRWRGVEGRRIFGPHPQWDGEPILEKTLLIYAEQGAGDAIQFARFLPAAAKRCKKLIVVCPRDLTPLIAAVDGVSEIREAGAVGVTEYDVYLPLLSLPRVFGTTVETVPADIPYMDLAAIRRRKNPATLQRSRPNSLKVGFVWAGNPNNRLDRYRSCPLRALVPLLRVPGVDFYSLQKGERARDLSELPSDIRVRDMAPALNDFGDLALVMDRLDLIISVDTSVAHLAGALGRPVWTLLAHAPDWRWLLDRDDSPWYPSMKLFRQSREGDWEELVQRVEGALRAKQRD
jgi:uncharacterized protein (TIGR03032 family)